MKAGCREVQIGESEMKYLIFLMLLLSALTSSAQTSRAPELRSCLTSEFALAILENADYSKSWDDNVDIGKKVGYVIAEFYQKSIWAMDNVEVEGRAVVMYAFENSQMRAKHMSKEQLKRDVVRCRKSFN